MNCQDHETFSPPLSCSADNAITPLMLPIGVPLPPKLAEIVKPHQRGAAGKVSVIVATIGIMVAATGMLSMMPLVTAVNTTSNTVAT